MRGQGALAEAELEVLDCLVDGDEPTVHVVDMLRKDAVEPLAREEVERRLNALEARGLVVRSLEWGGDDQRGLYEDDWWHVTEAGWCALADSGAYSDPDRGRGDLLSCDDPPVRRAVALLLLAGPRTALELTDTLLAAWGEPAASPAEVAGLAPGAFAWATGPYDHGRVQRLVEHRVGGLALDGVVTADDQCLWRLTEKGRAVVAGDAPEP